MTQPPPIVHWLLALAGFAAILKLDLWLHQAGIAVVVVFLLAGALSFLQRRLALLWAALAGGAVVTSEIVQLVTVQGAVADPSGFVVLALLPFGIAVAGAAAGWTATEFVRPDGR